MQINTRVPRESASQQRPDWPMDVRFLRSLARSLYAVAALLALAMLVLWALRQPIFNVGGIVIEGDVNHNSESSIRTHALPLIVGNYFTLNLAQAQRAFEAVPWVRSASLQRVWPNRLKVQLQEHRPVAFWSNEEGGDQLVNSFGEVFQANTGDVEDDALPTLSGPAGSAAQVLQAYVRLKPLFERIALPLQTLALTSRGSWQAELDQQAQVQLGRGTAAELAERVERFIRTVPDIMTRYERPLVFADLRHADGYAVRLKGVTTTVPLASAIVKR
jgi:cell division protein FtsQ